MATHKTSAIKRFLRHIEIVTESGCWVWMGALSNGGYATFWDGLKYRTGHRFSFESFRGEVPDGLQLDHLCRVRCCVNPHHLEPVTARENMRRSTWTPDAAVAAHRLRCAAITHCPGGHKYSPENTRYAKGTGKRTCMACDRIRHTPNPRGPITHCPHGHEYTLANTRMCGSSRQCRTCHRIQSAEYSRHKRLKSAQSSETVESALTESPTPRQRFARSRIPKDCPGNRKC